jgi:YjbE family integral membrane protein
VNSLLQVFDPAHIGAFFTQLQVDMLKPAFWLAVGKIIWINVLLSGDNALVIAMACRGLQQRQRLWGMVIGAGIAVVLLIAFTGIVVTLMALPYLKLIGGVALLVIAAKLLVPEDEGDGVTAGTSLWHAIRIIVIADIVMSLDNVIAVAVAASGQLSLLILGLAISIPIIIAGAALIMMVVDRLPIVVWLGAALLGWIAGNVIETDPAIHPFLHRLLDGQIAFNLDATSAIFNVSPHLSLDGDLVRYLCSVLGATAVLIVGSIWRKSKQHQAEQLALKPQGEQAQPIPQEEEAQPNPHVEEAQSIDPA